MIYWSPAVYQSLFFHFGVKVKDPSAGPPLVCFNGGIMVDSGNEAKSYLFSCQDRYPVYAALGGMRCLLFVRNSEHVDQYQANIASVARHMDIIQRYANTLSGFDIPEPLFVPCEIDPPEVRLGLGEKLMLQICDSEVINSHVRGGVYFNQLSPTISGLLSQFYDFLETHGIESQARLNDYQRMALCALEWHDKSRYVRLLKGLCDNTQLPPHIPTAMFSSRLLKSMNWRNLLELFQQQTGNTDTQEFFLKSGVDAAGEVSIILNRKNFDLESRNLTDEIAIKVNQMGRNKNEVQLLLQPLIERFDDACGLPSSVGVTYNIHDTNCIERLVIVGHVYEDPQRRAFIGSFQSEAFTQHVLQAIGEFKIIKLLQLFAEQGYRGPINLDAVRNSKGEYTFIYDSNPRLGGAFPGLILKSVLEQSGHQVGTLLTLGYRGRIIYPDIEAKLIELKGLDLLYTQNHQRGIYILPSLVRSDSYDLILINMEMKEMRQLIASGLINSRSDEGQSDLRGIYL